MYPFPLSNLASITEPFENLLGFAFNSSISASKKIFSINSSTPVPFKAEISCDWILPPQSSTNKFIPDNFSFILSGFATSLSILFIAKTIGTLAAWAWLMASFVWGIISSSAAITITTISVSWVPRALIAVNASWPGVSKNVILLPFLSLTL